MFKGSNSKKQLVDGRFLIETGPDQVVLGEGLSSKVLLATDTWQQHGKDSRVALKIIQENVRESKTRMAKIKAYFKEESNILSHIKHRNVIEMIAHGEAFILDCGSKSSGEQ
jgi:serine/threonine protein kinase